MKKTISMVIAAAAVLALVGCGSESASSTASSVASSAASTASSAASSTAAVEAEASNSAAKADGVYTAQMDDAATEASYGWRDELQVEYKDGKLVSATFESYDADGNKKSETTSDTYPMDPAPADWMPELSDNIVKAGNSADIDGITGATMASDHARLMLAAIEESGEPGETITVSEAADAE